VEYLDVSYLFKLKIRSVSKILGQRDCVTTDSKAVAVLIWTSLVILSLIVNLEDSSELECPQSLKTFEALGNVQREFFGCSFYSSIIKIFQKLGIEYKYVPDGSKWNVAGQSRPEAPKFEPRSLPVVDESRGYQPQGQTASRSEHSSTGKPLYKSFKTLLLNFI
jgi:hypothetical protein